VTRAKPKVVRLAKPKIDDPEFIDTLVWLLSRARAGQIRGYAMVYFVEDEKGGQQIIEGSRALENQDTHIMLGAIRRLEMGYAKRTWPEDFSP
jgi:hypothetical protein